MINSFSGRVSRRYLFIILAVIAFLALYNSVGPNHRPSLPASLKGSSSTLSPGKKNTYSDYTHFHNQKIEYKPSSYDWSKAKQYFPVQVMKTLPKGYATRFPDVQAPFWKLKQDEVSKARAEKIKQKFLKAWGAYKTHAWTLDELMPLSGKGKQSLLGWSAQIFDALDTLWLMDLRDEFQLGIQEVAQIDWFKTNDKRISVVDVTVQQLGGLLAAYDLSLEKILLAKAVELGDTLYAAFDTPNRLPTHYLNFMAAKNGQLMADTSISGAAGGSLCVEFTRLSQITQDPKYYDATERIKQLMLKWQTSTQIPGLWPKMMNFKEESVREGVYTFGAGSDSNYEYLPKMHALLGGLDLDYAEMTTKALDAALDHLIFKPMSQGDKNILLVGNSNPKEGRTPLDPEVQHLSCFAGGTYAFTGQLLGRPDFVDIGSRLTHGCVWAYESFATNIMPEVSEVVACPSQDRPCRSSRKAYSATRDSRLPMGFNSVKDPNYMLRPEAIESIFYMWRITGDPHWRDTAWKLWEAIVKSCETETAFAGVEDVNVPTSSKVDSMDVSRNS